MDYQYALYEKKDRIAYITHNRPEVMNALHIHTHRELADIWCDFRDDPEVWVAIVTGTGDKAFCAGYDLGGLHRGAKSLQRKEATPMEGALIGPPSLSASFAKPADTGLTIQQSVL